MISPIAVKTGIDDRTTLDVGRIVRMNQLPEDLTGTLLDPTILKNGVRLPLPFKSLDIFGREISFIDIPPLSPDGRIEKSGDMGFLHPLTVAANAIVAHQVQREGKPDRAVIQRLVTFFYMTLLSRITGHRGIIAKSVAGTRMSHSGRLVLIPQIKRSPEWVGISALAMKKALINEGDLIIIFRDPVIWTGSMEVVRAYPTEDDVIELHPLLFEQLGADCDGDQVAFVKPNYDVPGVKEEMERNLLLHTKEHATWPKTLCPGGLPSKPDWADIENDTSRRFVITGRSYGPRDVVGFSEEKTPKNVRLLEELCGKDFGQRNRTIALDEKDDNWNLLVSTNSANMYMKRLLGVIGATCRRFLLTGGEDPWLRRAVNWASETLQQTTLDAKHRVGDKKVPSPIEIMQMFERKGPWAKSTLGECKDLLMRGEVPEEDASRLVLHFRVELPIHLLIETNVKSKVKQVEAKKMLRAALSDEKGNALMRFNLMPTFSFVASVINEENPGQIALTAEDLFNEMMMNYRMGLRQIVERYYPGAALINKSTTGDHDRAAALYQEVFHKKTPDRGSLFSHVFPALKDEHDSQPVSA